MDETPLNFFEQILEGLRALGERPALSEREHVWTGRELLELTAGSLAWLRQRGLGAGKWLDWAAGEHTLVLPVRLAAMHLGAGFRLGARSDDGVTLTPEDLARLAPASAPLDDLPGARGARAVEEHVAPRKRAREEPAGIEGSLGAFGEALGDAPELTTVFLPLTRLGGDAALVSFAAGAAVHLELATSAGQVLTLLERTHANGAVLSRTLLRRLLAHPALTLSELGSLRAVLYEAEPGSPFSLAELSDARQHLSAKLIEHRAPEISGADAWKTSARGDAVPSADARLAERLVSQLNQSLEREFDPVRTEAALAPLDALARLSLDSMLNALERAGAFRGEHGARDEEQVLSDARVALEHRPLVRRWLRALIEQGLLSSDDGRLRVTERAGARAVTERAWDDLERHFHEIAGASKTIEYARENAASLPALLSGEARAVHLLFPKGRPERARALYRESITARYQHRAAALLVGLLVRASVHRGSVRVLEVGGGTGATTESVLPELAGMPVDYLFTDVSRYFLETSAPSLSAFPGVRFGLYDLDRPPEPQGFSAGSFDVVVAGGALNAVRNTDRSLAWLRELLPPHGWLVLTEPTQEEFWVMASQAFMLAPQDDARAPANTTFLTWPAWRTALDQAGLDCIVDLPPPEHPLARPGHRVFGCRARANGARRG